MNEEKLIALEWVDNDEAMGRKTHFWATRAHPTVNRSSLSELRKEGLIDGMGELNLSYSITPAGLEALAKAKEDDNRWPKSVIFIALAVVAAIVMVVVGG